MSASSSALVYLAAELPLIAKQRRAKIIEINLEETQMSTLADVSLRGKASEILPVIFAQDNTGNPLMPEDTIIESSFA